MILDDDDTALRLEVDAEEAFEGRLQGLAVENQRLRIELERARADNEMAMREWLSQFGIAELANSPGKGPGCHQERFSSDVRSRQGNGTENATEAALGDSGHGVISDPEGRPSWFAAPVDE